MDLLIGKQSSETDGYTRPYIFSRVFSVPSHTHQADYSLWCALPLANVGCWESEGLHENCLNVSCLAAEWHLPREHSGVYLMFWVFGF